MNIISESYKKKLMSLAGLNVETLTEASRVDFLKNDFIERVGRKYDKFLKFYSLGNWNSEKENDKFIKNIIWTEKLAFLKGKNLIPRQKFVETMTNTFFTQLENADPTENKQYLNWLTNIFLAGNLPTEDIYKANESLILFSKNKEKIPINQRNINSFTDLQTLFEVVSKYSHEEEMSTSEKEKIIKLEGAEQIYDSPNWKIIIPKTKEAACLYGKSTQWCTASENSNRFDYYNQQSPLYILIDKRIRDDRDVFKKLQFHFSTEQFMDTTDKQIKITKFFKENPELRDLFKKIGEIDASFEIEHMLVSKEEGLNLLKTIQNKINLINRKGFDFLKRFYIEIGATNEFKQIILFDGDFIKFLFKKEFFTELINSYKELEIQSEGLQTIKSLTWLNSWIMDENIKPETVQNLIFSLCQDLGKDGKEFAKHLLKRGGVIWNSLLQKNKNQISHYFNMISSRKSLGQIGLKMVKEMLEDKSVIDELLSKGISKTTLNMLHNFYSVIKESYQGQVYLNNILKIGS